MNLFFICETVSYYPQRVSFFLNFLFHDKIYSEFKSDKVIKKARRAPSYPTMCAKQQPRNGFFSDFEHLVQIDKSFM